MAIRLTERAADHVRRFLAKGDGSIGLRLGVKKTGCSGLAYVIEFVDELRDDDEVFESNGVKVVVDKKSLVFLDGTEVDYAKVGLQEGFQFKNPNAKDACGCGESFTV